MKTKIAQVVVVTPHPDDAEYGVAGTVVRWVSQGKEVVYVVCTNGDKGTSDATPIRVWRIHLSSVRRLSGLSGCIALRP
jgi:LmbE family N-acetylglucosaminyl deacetylase